MNRSTSTKILDQSLISPPPPASGELRPSLPLTFFDMIWLNYSPVERLFFYTFPHSTSHFLHSHLPIIKSSLSLCLSIFYPFAGAIRRRSSGDRFEIAVSSSDSVPLTVAEYEGCAAEFDEISGDHCRPIEKLLELVPKIPISREAQPLLAVKITLFPNYGLCLAVAVHHACCDGFSSMQFVRFWSGFRREEPVIDRTVIPDPRNLYRQMEKVALDEREKEQMMIYEIASGIFAATFVLSSAEIGKMKKLVEKMSAEQGKPCFHCSAFVIAGAYSWICLQKTRLITDGDGNAHFIFAVDWRRRIRPEIPANYFGNCLGGCFVKCGAEELLSKDGIFMACAAIGKSIEELGDDVHEKIDGLFDKLGQVAPWRPLTIAGSPKMKVYETDFGWGKPRKVEVTSTRETGAMAFAESRDGDGGIEIGVILPEKDLNAFGHFFAAGMDG